MQLIFIVLPPQKGSQDGGVFSSPSSVNGGTLQKQNLSQTKKKRPQASFYSNLAIRKNSSLFPNIRDESWK